MTRGTRRLATLLAIAALATPIAAQQTPQSTVPPATGTGAISGVVTTDDGSRPVRFAYVLLIGLGKGVLRVSATDAEGRFTFPNLPADRYTLAASKPPLLGAIAGARRPGRSGSPIVLADGQRITDAAVRMPAGAAISGTVTDERGRPSASTVGLWRVQGADRRMVSIPSVRADDRGRYRFFGLVPGEYVVAAMVPDQVIPEPLSTAAVDAALRTGSAPAAQPGQQGGRFLHVFFPSTTRLADAASVTVGAGDDRFGIDIRLQKILLSQIEGTVMGVDGRSGDISAGDISAVPLGPVVTPAIYSYRVGPTGEFRIPSLTPGTYAVIFSGVGATAGFYARADVDVTGAPRTNVQLTLRPTMTLAGRILFRGTGPSPAAAGQRVPVRPLGPQPLRPPAVSVTDAEGVFRVTNVVPGQYVIGGPASFGATSDSVIWALESVVVDGRDVTDVPIDISGDAPPKAIVVTYTDRFQELSGRLTSATGAPVSEHTIVVFPEDKAYWRSGSRRIVVTRPGTDGRFTLSGQGPTTMPAGKYLLAAVTDIDRDEQFDPAFLSALVAAAVPVTLSPGDKKIQDLVVR